MFGIDFNMSDFDFAPGPEPLGRPKRRSLLDAVAGRLGDMGYGGGEEAKRVALRRALGAVGERLVAGSTREGFGALAPAVSGGFGAYRNELEGLHKERQLEDERKLKIAQAERQSRYTDALTRQAEEGADQRRLAQEEVQRKVEERRAQIAERDAFIAGLPESQQARLRGVRGADEDSWASAVIKVTEAPKPDKPDYVRTNPNDQIFLPDPKDPTKLVKVLERGPAPRQAGGEGGGSGKSGKPLFRSVNGRTMMWDDGAGAFIDPPGAAADVEATTRKQAQQLYSEALRVADHPLRARAKAGGVDVGATWKNAWAAAKAANPTGATILGDPGGMPGPPPAPSPPPAPAPRPAPAKPAAKSVDNSRLEKVRKLIQLAGGRPQAEAELRRQGKTPEQIKAILAGV